MTDRHKIQFRDGGRLTLFTTSIDRGEVTVIYHCVDKVVRIDRESILHESIVPAMMRRDRARLWLAHMVIDRPMHVKGFGEVTRLDDNEFICKSLFQKTQSKTLEKMVEQLKDDYVKRTEPELESRGLE